MVIRWSSTTGAFKWMKRYAGLAKGDDAASDVVVDPSGNAIVCGSTENADGLASWVVLKYSPSGTRLWTRTFDGSATKSERPVEMYVDGAGNIYVTGYSWATTTVSAHTVKLSPAGKTLWSRKYKGPDDGYSVATAIVRRPAGGVYVAGHTDTDAGGQDVFLLHYTAAGDRKLYALYDGHTAVPTVQTINDIAVISNGLIFGVGQHNDTDPAWVVWQTTGALYATQEDGTPGSDWWEGVVADAYGGVYITGPYDNASVNPNIRTQRLNIGSTGGGWLYDYDGDGYDREVNAIAVNGLSVAVVGRQYDGATYNQYIHIWTY